MNWGDRKAICLALVVGFSLVVPVNQFASSRENFYLLCGLFEILFALIALYINTRASSFIVLMCVILLSLHVVAWDLDSHNIDSPYWLLAKVVEHAQIVACIAFAAPFMRLSKK